MSLDALAGQVIDNARPHDLIGIYNQQATLEMIVDDLKCVGLQ